MTDKQKILKVLELEGITESKAEQICGFGVGTISKMVKRDGSLHKDNAEKFQRTFKIRAEWWKTGKGDVFETETPKAEETDENNLPVDKLIETVIATFESLKIELTKKNNQIEWLQRHIDGLVAQNLGSAKQRQE